VALVERRFCDGIGAGEILSDFPVTVRAIRVTDFARGLPMRARIGTPRKTLLRDAEEAADQGNRVHVRAAQYWPNCRRRLGETPLLFATGARA